MTPPVTKPAAPATPPAPPAADPAPAAKVEAKAEVKAAAPAVAATPSPDATPPVFDAADPGSWSVKVDLGYGGRNMGNEQGIDHGGFNFKLGAGPRFRFFDDKLSLALRGFYDYQGLNKDLGQGVESSATIHSFGLQTDLGYAFVPSWFSAHALLDLGAAHYTAEESRDGMKGAEFNKNALLFPLSNTSFMFGLGAQLCTWGDAVCVGAGYRMEPGVNPKLDVVDGNYPAMGLSPNGFTAGGGIDILRIVDNIRGGGVSKPRSASRPKDEDKQPADAAKPGAAPVTPGTPGAPVQPAAKPALTGLALVESLRDENKGHVEVATKNAKAATLDLGEVKKKPADGGAYANDAVHSYRMAQEKMNAANENVAKIKAEVEKLSGDDKKKAEAVLKEATTAADEANKQARAAWDQASEAVKQYNKARGTNAEIDFPDSKPDAQGKVAAKPAGKPAGKPAAKTEPKKEEPKKEEPKKEEPKKEEPKKEEPKKAEPKKGDGAEW